jgi:hypothetical protein
MQKQNINEIIKKKDHIDLTERLSDPKIFGIPCTVEMRNISFNLFFTSFLEFELCDLIVSDIFF